MDFFPSIRTGKRAPGEKDKTEEFSLAFTQRDLQNRGTKWHGMEMSPSLDSGLGKTRLYCRERGFWSLEEAPSLSNCAGSSALVGCQYGPCGTLGVTGIHLGSSRGEPWGAELSQLLKGVPGNSECILRSKKP